MIACSTVGNNKFNHPFKYMFCMAILCYFTYLTRWPKCLHKKSHSSIECWQDAYKRRCLCVSGVSQAIHKAIAVLLYKEAVPKALIKLLGPSDKIYEDGDFSVEFLLDELLSLAQSKW